MRRPSVIEAGALPADKRIFLIASSDKPMTMKVTLRQLRAFIEVARAKSFTDAAARLYITQSALSGLIKDLERGVGVQLVHRTTRSIQLTRIGADFLPLAQRTLDDLERALGSISESLDGGRVRIAVPQLMACTLLPQVISAFAAEHPKIEVLVADSIVEDISSRVLSGEVDLGIGPERPSSEELVARPLIDMPFLAVFPEGHPLGQQDQVPWAELARHPLISLRGDYTRMLNSELLKSPAHIEFNPAFEVTFMSTALSMVSSGLGVTTCLRYAASLLDLHRLHTRPLVDPVIIRRFHIYTRSDRPLGPAAQCFTEYLIAHAHEHGWGVATGVGGSAATPKRARRR